MQIGSETTLSILRKRSTRANVSGVSRLMAYGGDFILNPFCALSGTVSVQRCNPHTIFYDDNRF